MAKKVLSEDTFNRYRNLYEDNYSIVVVNNVAGRCVHNTRKSIRQGDKFAMELFAYGMDSVLGDLLSN